MRLSAPNTNRATRATALVALLAGGLAAAGCQRAATPPATTRAAEIALRTDTAENAARTILELLQAHLRAIAAGNPALAADMRDRAVNNVIDRAGIIARLQRASGKHPSDEQAVLRTHVESWAALVAYYIDGLRDVELAATETAATGAVVNVPARGRTDSAVIRIACVCAADGGWRIAAIGVEPANSPPGSRTAASQRAASTTGGGSGGRER